MEILQKEGKVLKLNFWLPDSLYKSTAGYLDCVPQARGFRAGKMYYIIGKYRSLVHRIAAFTFAFAMAIPRCQWRHRCVVTLGKFLVVLYSKPL